MVCSNVQSSIFWSFWMEYVFWDFCLTSIIYNFLVRPSGLTKCCVLLMWLTMSITLKRMTKGLVSLDKILVGFSRFFVQFLSKNVSNKRFHLVVYPNKLRIVGVFWHKFWPNTKEHLPSHSIFPFIKKIAGDFIKIQKNGKVF